MSKPTFRSGVTPRSHPAASLGAAAPVPPTEVDPTVTPAPHPMRTAAAESLRSAPASRPPRRPTSQPAESQAAATETPQQFPLWTRADVAERLRAATLGRRVRFVDVILAQIEDNADRLDEIVRSTKEDGQEVPSTLFGTRRTLSDQEPAAMVQVTVQGLLPSQRRTLEQLAARHGVRASQLVTAVLDHSLPKRT